MNYLHFHFSFVITFCMHFSSNQREKNLWIQFSCLRRGLAETLLVWKKKSRVIVWSGVFLHSCNALAVRVQCSRPDYQSVKSSFLPLVIHSWWFWRQAEVSHVLGLTVRFFCSLWNCYHVYMLLPLVACNSCRLLLLILINFKFGEILIFLSHLEKFCVWSWSRMSLSFRQI